MNYYTCGAKVYSKEKKAYAIANYNGIKVLNDDEETIYIDQDNIDLSYAYYNILLYMNKFFFIPYRAEKILIVDCEKKEIRTIHISCDISRTSNKWFATSFIYGNKIYMFGDSFPGILILNAATEEYQIKKVEGIDYSRGNRRFFSFGFHICDNKAFVPMGYTGAFLELSLLNDSFEIKKLPIKLDGIESFSHIDEYYYVLGPEGDKNKIVRIHKNTAVCDEICFSEIENMDGRVFYPPVMFCDDIYVFPNHGEKAYVISFSNNKIEEFSAFNRKVLQGELGVDCVELVNNILRVQTRTTCRWIEYDMKKNEIISELKRELPEVNIARLKKRFSESYIVCESDGSSLNDLVLLIKDII
ncbi:hypothetical protein SAMN02910298_01398 [Pseudobutyrivibrio sp. YE44]|uniref:hypothetical protein n=1 Tax=Pseudobutyrivibrio sp. YE44 TaxID=1520802 RepID=UPI000882D48C|nr:hypothetical protein [Pseudobutyrivibrio sp. YE44]SDB28809.1 hypothetical protein SAMN02910298_01398 [Pseudobutyrivibrio sp. YE44]